MVDIQARGNRGFPQLDARRSILLRWWLLAAAAVAVTSAPALLDVALPLAPMLAVLLLMAGFNAWLRWRAAGGEIAAAGDLFGQVCVDLAALGVLLYFSGGAANPLISLLLIPVAVAALSLPGRFVAAVALLAVAIYSLLMWHYLPLAIYDPERAARLHLAGMWLTFVVSATLIAWFVARMTESLLERDRSLAAAREQALRDERVVALGAMAAGAAHELGTPLGTIAVLVGELERDPALDAEARADLALVLEQLALCKDIIGSMASRAGALPAERLRVEDAIAWLEGVRARWHAVRPRACSRLVVEPCHVEARVAIDPALEQAVANLLNNAADADCGEVRIGVACDAAKLRLTICDDGPGFPPEILRGGGREPVPARPGGAGIGLFLAFSVVERMGGAIALDNPATGGGRATIELPLLSPAAN